MPMINSASAKPGLEALAAALTKYDGHPFERATASGACARCGEHAEHILHHPTRIRAACLLRGIDWLPLLPRAQR
jgi:hypothetical protein